MCTDCTEIKVCPGSHDPKGKRQQEPEEAWLTENGKQVRVGSGVLWKEGKSVQWYKSGNGEFREQQGILYGWS